MHGNSPISSANTPTLLPRNSWGISTSVKVPQMNSLDLAFPELQDIPSCKVREIVIIQKLWDQSQITNGQLRQYIHCLVAWNSSTNVMFL